MANLRLDIDVSSIAAMANGLKEELEIELKKGVANLAAQTNQYVRDLATAELGTTRKKFIETVGFEEIEKGIWVVSISQDGLWIEEGLDNGFDMKPGLLTPKSGSKGGVHTSKDGYRYRVIPFDHTDVTTKNNYGKGLIDKIKMELKNRSLPYKNKLEMENGSPKLGRLHSFDIKSSPPIGSKGNTPELHRVTIYQEKNKDTGKVNRKIFTFRTVSDNPAMADKWKHPGYTGRKFLDRAELWAERTWETEILPAILDKMKNGR